eukprot:COSAG05_NODE_10192_length_578_cov_1.256785_1_plen_57_part_01
MNLDPRRKTITALFFFLQPDFSWMGAIQLDGGYTHRTPPPHVPECRNGREMRSVARP